MGVFEQLERVRVIPLVVLHKAESADALAEALVQGGLPVAEISFSVGDAAQTISTMAQRRDLLVGAATVLTPTQVDAAVDAGAQYVASPGNCPEVFDRCLERGVPYLGGVATATEIQRALAMGLTWMRFFPAGSLGGVAGIKMLSKSFPQVRFIPTGGVGAAHIRDYLSLRSVVAVGGSWMVPGQALARADFKEVRDRAAHTVRLAKAAPRPASTS